MPLLDNTEDKEPSVEFVETYNKRLWLGHSKDQNNPYCNAAESDTQHCS